jgi:predicted amidohydrolase
MIPKNIKREHILKAMKEIEKLEIPKARHSKKFLLEYNDKHYYPKYVISLANKYANGKALDSSEFSGGNESNNFLSYLGFKVVGIQSLEKPTPKPSKNNDEIHHRKTAHDERCPICKETVRALLKKIYGTVKTNYKFEIGTNPQNLRNSPRYDNIKEIYEALQNYRGFKKFVKAKTLPNCDFFVPNPGFIVEFDESQHFTVPRKTALKHYPEKLELGFERKRWVGLCERINAKDNDPRYRDEQRAWYDTLRDFMPEIKGLNPTVRIFAKDFVWCSLDPNNPRDVEKFKSMITQTDRTAQLRIVLCVPKKQSDTKRVKWEKDVKDFAKENGANLIVFPEGYIKCKFDDAVSKVKARSEEMGMAILTGVETEEGYQLSVFYNPNPENGETKEHIYIKHSSADKLAYEWPKYKGKDDAMFDPIIFRGRKIGVMICHDMFFPLITHTLVDHGAEVLVDLTGGNVNSRKWNNIIKARSIEIGGTFLCTMGYEPNENGKSFCVVYENGKCVLKEERPGFYLATIPSDSTFNDEGEEEQSFSSKKYSDITISFNKYKKADLKIIKTDNSLRISSRGKELRQDREGWRKVKKGNEIIGLLVLHIEEITNRILILEKRPKSNVDYCFVLYHGDSPISLSDSDLIAFAKLRAIESRVVVLILSGKLQEVLKTTKYKNIQRFKDKNGVIGFNKESLGGPESIFSGSRIRGIPQKFKERYLELLTTRDNK